MCILAERLHDIMYDMEMGHADYDRSNRTVSLAPPHADHYCIIVIKADDACLLAMELNYNPIVDDVAAFDIYPE